MPERSRKDTSGKDPIAVELGRRGGLKGGKARAAKMTPEERAESARKAAQARWAGKREESASRRNRENERTEERPILGPIVRGETMTRARIGTLTGIFVLAGLLTLFLVLLTGRSSGHSLFVPKAGAAADPDSAAAKPGLGPTAWEAYQSAMRTYPAAAISPAMVAREKATFNRLVKRDARLRKLRHGRSFFADGGGNWKQYGPRKYGVQPGVTSFSGATNVTASRITALVVSPDCGAKAGCTVWVGASGGGIWRTDNALAPDP
jgi:hypothetical protein